MQTNIIHMALLLPTLHQPPNSCPKHQCPHRGNIMYLISHDAIMYITYLNITLAAQYYTNL